MENNRIVLTNKNMLANLFDEAKSAYESFSGDFNKSIYGTLTHLKNMQEIELKFSPYTELAESCEMSTMSLKKSSETGRIYLWNVNHGGHAPRLELRPVLYEHLLDLPLMKSLHENWAYQLGCNIDLDADYII